MALPEGYENRIVCDEDVPSPVTSGLVSRGFVATNIHELRERIHARRGKGAEGGSISDDEVCDEVATEPSVLITLNIRDYADLEGIRQLVIAKGVSVVNVRVPKAESRARLRPAAINDIVHRNAPRIAKLAAGPPSISTATRRGLRTRSVEDIKAAGDA